MHAKIPRFNIKTSQRKHICEYISIPRSPLPSSPTPTPSENSSGIQPELPRSLRHPRRGRFSAKINSPASATLQLCPPRSILAGFGCTTLFFATQLHDDCTAPFREMWCDFSGNETSVLIYRAGNRDGRSKKGFSGNIPTWAASLNVWAFFPGGSWIIRVFELSCSLVAHNDEKLGSRHLVLKGCFIKAEQYCE